MTTRLFVAIWPSDAAREALVQTVEEARGDAPDVRWQPPDRWHVTVAFLGPADPARAAARIDVRARAHRLPGAEPIRLHGSGSFGPVIWVGVDHGPWLAELARGLQTSLHVADRRFRGHVTVGRARGAAGSARATEVVPSLAAHDGPAWRPDSFTLVESVAGPAPEYHVLQRWPLDLAARGADVAPTGDTEARSVPDSGVPTSEEP